MKKIICFVLLCAMVPCAGMMDSYSEDDYSGGDSYASEEYLQSPEPVRKKRKKGKGHRRTRSRRPAEEIEGSQKRRRSRSQGSRGRIENSRASINMLNLNQDDYSYEDELYDLEDGEKEKEEFIAFMHMMGNGKIESDTKSFKVVKKWVNAHWDTDHSEINYYRELLRHQKKYKRYRSPKDLHTSRSNTVARSARQCKNNGYDTMDPSKIEAILVNGFTQLTSAATDHAIEKKDDESSAVAKYGVLATIITSGMGVLVTYFSMQPTDVAGSVTVLQSCMISCALQMTECLASCAV